MIHATKRGILLNKADDNDITLTSFPKVKQLFEKFYMADSITHSPEIITDTIELASVMFGKGGFSYFASLDADKDAYLKDFLADTREFIATGQRRLNPKQWNTLVPEYTVEELEEHVKKHRAEKHILYEQYSHEDLAKWINHEGGIYDILCTMYVLFS